MKRSIVPCILFIVILTSSLLYSAEEAKPPAQASAPHDILILNSYHPGYAWSDDEQAGMIDVFRGKDKNWLPVVEYLDFKRLPDGRHLAELKKLFRLKYRDKKFSVVIAMDNPALEFAIDNQEKLFGNATIVFCGIDNYNPSLLKGRSDVTGIVEAIDIAGTIEVMLRLHPAAREIYALHDYTTTGLAKHREIETLASRLGARVRLRYNDPVTMEELLKELERLPKDSLVLAVGFINDKTGRVFGISESTKLFSERSPVPIYSTYEQRLGFGIVGGRLLSARHHGTHAASIALRVLAGEKASAIPIAFESDSRFMFDYKVMSRFGIPLSALPEGSTVINKPASFYAAHRAVIQTALVIIGIMAVVISLLTANIVQRRRYAIELQESEASFKELYDMAPVGYHEYDAEGRITRVNQTDLDMLGYSREEMIGQYIWKMNRDEVAREVILAKLAGKLPPGRQLERTYIRKDGTFVPVLIEDRLITDGHGKIKGIRCTIQNITERKRTEKELQASREQMRALAGRLQSVREEERTNMARAIHDELGGALTGLKIDFSLLTRAALKIENETVRTSLLAGMNSMIKSIDSTIQTIRRIAMELRPGILDDLGLVAALEWQLKDFEKRTGIRCTLSPPAEDVSLDANLSTALFRIFQEALTNVINHAGATEVRVRLCANTDSAILEVEDNGKGIEREKILSPKSLGLLGMRERAQMFGGRFTVTGAPGKGTKVTVEVSPVENRRTDRQEGGVAG